MRKVFFLFVLLVVPFLQNGCERETDENTIVLPGGATYVGEMKNDQPNGYGTQTYPDGAKFEGQFVDGKREGQGTMDFPDGRRYVGQWKENMFYGQGTLTFPDGSKYVGEFKHKPNGEGRWTQVDGSEHEGTFKDGKLFDGRIIFPGVVEKGTLHADVIVVKEGEPVQERKASIWRADGDYPVKDTSENVEGSEGKEIVQDEPPEKSLEQDQELKDPGQQESGKTPDQGTDEDTHKQE